VQVLFHNGKAIAIELPTFIEVKIKETDPGFKGDTVSGATKPAIEKRVQKFTFLFSLKRGFSESRHARFFLRRKTQ